MKILLADDNSKMRSLVKSILSGGGNTFCESADGADAILSYRREMPDIVLMDIEMGDIDGFTATRAILDVDPKAHVIIVSKYDDPLVQSRALQAGAKAVVPKSDLSKLKPILKLVH